MNPIIPLMAVLVMASPSIHATAQPPERKRDSNAQQQRGTDGQTRRGMGREGQRPMGQRSVEQRPGGPGANAMMNMDPAKIAQRMMSRFDKDGDAKLNQSELLAMLTSMRERRGMGQGTGNEADRDGGQRGKGRPRGDSKRGDNERANNERASKKRRPQNDNDEAEPGGTEPLRPTAE